MTFARNTARAALLAASIGVPLACGGRSEAGASYAVGAPAAAPSPACAPGQPCPPPGPPPACPPGQVCAPPSSPTSVAAPLGSVYTTDPSALASLLASAAAAATAWLGPPSGGGDPAEAGLRDAAAKYAPGMSPEGPMAKGTLPEGGHLGFLVNLEPTKCYAIVAYGVGVADLDVNLLVPPLYNFLAAQDGMPGPAAVIGAAPAPMCPAGPLTLPYKVDLFAKHGGGPVAAQVYSRPR